MPCSRTNLQLLSQNGPLLECLPAGCQRSRDLQTPAQEAHRTRPQARTHLNGRSRRELSPPPKDSIQFKHCFTISDTQPYSANVAAAAVPCLQHWNPDKGHFVLLDLMSPNSELTTQIPFQIDSAASCNTLPSNLLASMPWAKLAATKTVITPYASPPIKPICQIILKAGKGNTTCDVTFQVINTDQPALLSTEDSKALGVLTLNAYFIRKCSTAKRPPTPDPGVHKDSAAGPPLIPPDTSKHLWPDLGTLTMYITVPNFFMALASLALLLISILTETSCPSMSPSTVSPSQN